MEDVETITNAAPGVEQSPETETQGQHSANEVVNDLHSALIELAEQEARIVALRESFRDRFGVHLPGSAHWSKKVTVRAKVEMEFDADDRLAIVGRWLTLRYESEGVVRNVRLLGEREAYDTVSEPAEDGHGDEFEDELENADEAGECPAGCKCNETMPHSTVK